MGGCSVLSSWRQRQRFSPFGLAELWVLMATESRFYKPSKNPVKLSIRFLWGYILHWNFQIRNRLLVLKQNLKLNLFVRFFKIFFRSPCFKFRWKWFLPSKQCCNCCKMGQKRRKSSENSHRWFGCAPWTINSIQFLWRSKCFIFLHTQVKHIIIFFTQKREKKIRETSWF